MKFSTWNNNQHKAVRIAQFLLLSATLLLLDCIPGFLKDDKIEVATTIERSIVDKGVDPARVLLETDDHNLVFHSEPIENLFGSFDGRLVVDEAADGAVRQLYPQRAYAVKVRLCIERTTRTFLVDRDAFNALRVGVIAKFVMNPNETAIDSLIAY